MDFDLNKIKLYKGGSDVLDSLDSTLQCLLTKINAPGHIIQSTLFISIPMIFDQHVCYYRDLHIFCFYFFGPVFLLKDYKRDCFATLDLTFFTV